MLEVPTWYWGSLELGALIDRGAVSPADISGRAWTLATIVWSSVREAQRVAEWEAERQAKAIEAVKRSRG